MKMLETQVGQLAGRPMGNKEEFPRQLQGPKTAKATQAHSGEMEDHTKDTMKLIQAKASHGVDVYNEDILENTAVFYEPGTSNATNELASSRA
jgi:hypothetical protein